MSTHILSDEKYFCILSQTQGLRLFIQSRLKYPYPHKKQDF